MRVCTSCGHAVDGDFAYCPHCGTELAEPGPARELRKTVTVLFCDVTGSTALGESVDPEALRRLLARYFERMKEIVERHGGTVEKFIGDAVMAVFGVPVLHEDDALRAVRAAAEMRDAWPELGIQARIGVDSGEIVTGTEERLATGDAVNVAARLEQAAPPGQVLIGRSTLALVQDAAEVEELEPLELKGKAERVAAYRLMLVRDSPERLHATPFVGRALELAFVREAWARAEGERRCELVTVVGEAGVGKSRLAAEALSSIDATVVRGRCLPYGEGITYWPVVEVLKQLDLAPTDESVAVAIDSLLGETIVSTDAEEIAWAFRKTLEQAAAERPVAVIFEDLQWGEQTFLDLIEHVALLASGAPILLFCLTRPELIDRRPTWPVTLRLAPLGDEDVAELIPEQLPGDLRERISRAAGGNPLFLEEMLAMAGEAEAEVTVPPTLQALLASRLDQLEVAERSVLERGAVEGEVFHRGAVQALTTDGIQVTPRLAALARKEMIRPTTPLLEGEDGFRFRHLLIRDAAYDALPKAARAELHARFAAWLEERGAELVELDEVLGYHFEQACRYRRELGLPLGPELALSARRRLGSAADRALRRADGAASVNLLERAVAVVGPGDTDVALETTLVDALLLIGRTDDALHRARSISERAAAAGDRVGELWGRLAEGFCRFHVDPEGAARELSSLVDDALPEFEARGEHFALYAAYFARGVVANMRGLMDTELEALEQAYAHARQAGLSRDLIGWRSSALLRGSVPLPKVLAWMDEQEAGGARALPLRMNKAEALAMVGRFDEARELVGRVRTEVADRGGGVRLAMTMNVSAHVEFLAGDLAAAADFGERACRTFGGFGEKSFQSTAAAALGRVLYELDRLEEADDWARRAAELGASDDFATQALWRQARGKVLARRGDLVEGERLAREAVALAEETESPIELGDTYADLAEVLLFANRPQEAAETFQQALACFEQKGHVVMADRVRARIAALRERAGPRS
jgi:class 3 adenylate cyclase/tetratricopeptide (TPR) repeat protein